MSVSSCLIMIEIFPQIWIMNEISLHCLKWLHIHLSSKRKVNSAFSWHILIIVIIFICCCEWTKRVWILCLFKYFLLFFFKRFFEKLHCSIDWFKVDLFTFWLFPFWSFVLNLLNSWRYYCWRRALAWPLTLLYTTFLSSKFFWSLRRLWFSFLCCILNKSFILSKYKWNLLDCEVKFESIFWLFLWINNRHFLCLSWLFHLN